MAPHSNTDTIVSDKPNSAIADIKLVTISASKLLSNDKQTQDDLLDACKSLGFFYLDCRDHPLKPTMELVNGVAEMALDFFGLPLSTKEEFTKLSYDIVKTGVFALVFLYIVLPHLVYLADDK